MCKPDRRLPTRCVKFLSVTVLITVLLLFYREPQLHGLQDLQRTPKSDAEPQLHGQQQDLQCDHLPVDLVGGGYRKLLPTRDHALLSEDMTRELPRLAIVVSIDVRMFCTYRAALSAISCYGARHGIPVFMETVQLQKDRHYFQSRTVHIMKYLQVSF